MPTTNEKLTKLKHLVELGNRTKVELKALDAKIQDIVTIGGQPNIIEEIQVNGVKQDVSNKIVNILMATKVSELENDAKYQNDTEVSAAIQAAIAASGHAHFEKVDAVPGASEAKDNVLYLVMNATTGHYDIYAKVGGEVVLLDDTTVDLSPYSTTEQVNGLIDAAIEALSIGDYAKAADLTAAVNRISGVEGKLDGIETTVVAHVASAIDALKIGDYAKASELAALAGRVAAIEADYLKAADRTALEQSIGAVDAKFANYYSKTDIDGMIATDAEVTAALDGVFGD